MLDFKSYRDAHQPSAKTLKILFDQSPPRPLARYLKKHAVMLALHVGLDRTPKGDLIEAAEKLGFGLLITSDKISGINRT